MSTTDEFPTLDGTNHLGLWFGGVTVPNNETISTAKLTFDELSNFSATTALNATLYGHATDNAINFSVASKDISNRPRTVASKASLPSTDAWKTGIDVTAIVQEIVNRTGWASGNAMVLMLIGTGTSGSNIQPYLWDYFSGFYLARLQITYGTAATNTTRFFQFF